MVKLGSYCLDGLKRSEGHLKPFLSIVVMSMILLILNYLSF